MTDLVGTNGAKVKAELEEWLEDFKLMSRVELETVYSHGRCNLGLALDHPKMHAIAELIKAAK